MLLPERINVPTPLLSKLPVLLTVPVIAVSLGACVIEKHITTSRAVPGPDSAFSLEPQEFAAMVAAVVYAADSDPIRNWVYSALWLGLLALLSFLMISTWRYPSFKDLNLVKPQSPLSFILMGVVIYMIWSFPQPVLLAMSVVYVGSGIVIRIGGLLRRRWRGQHHPEPPPREQHVG